MRWYCDKEITQLAYISFRHKSCCRETLIECLSLQILMTGCFFDDAPTCVCFLAAWQSVFIRTQEAMHDRSLISYLQVFHDAEHNLVQTGSLRETHTHTRLGISITNDWKDMMTNSDALQGQKYTNGVGAVPRGMTAAASDVCSFADGELHFVSWVQLEHTRNAWPPLLWCSCTHMVRGLFS